MRATFDARTIRDALSLVSKFFGRSSAFPADRLVELTTRDGSGVVSLRRAGFGVDARAHLDAHVEGGGSSSVFVDAAELDRAIPKTGTVLLWTDVYEAPSGDATKVRLVLDGGGSVASVPLRDGADFLPRIPDGTPFARIAPDELDAIGTTIRAAGSEDDTRAVLTGVAFVADGNGRGTAVTTDTYRLHGTRLGFVDGEPRETTIIPARPLSIAVRTAAYDVTIGRSDSWTTLRYTSKKGPKRTPRIVECWTAVRTIEGPFPNYGTLIPDTEEAPFRWTVGDAAGTATALRVHKNRQNAPTVFAAAGSAVSVTTRQDGTELVGTVPFETDGSAFELALNASYAADAFEHAGDGATVYLRDGLKALYAENERTFSLLMPMRVS